MNVLITNVGRRGYLVDYLKSIPNFNGNVYVSDCINTASGLYVKNYVFFILSKSIDDKQVYFDSLIKLCHRKSFELFILVINLEITILSKYLDSLNQQKINFVFSSRNFFILAVENILLFKVLKGVV